MTAKQTYRPEVRRALPALVGQRWITNIGIRVMFTFLPSFARGSGLSIEQLGLLLTGRDLAGLAAPATGRLIDRRGTAPVLGIAGFIAATGLLLGAFSAVGLAVGLVVMGIGKVGFDVGLNSWIGQEVAYERRARAFGQIELTWALAGLIGLPIAGLLIDHVAWWSVPLVLGSASMLLSFRIRQVVAATETAKTTETSTAKVKPRVIRMLASLTGLVLASQLLFITHGLWLEDTHGLSPSRIGGVVVLFGIIEMIGTLTTATLTDRVGKRRSVLAGSALLVCGTTGLVLFPDVSLPYGLAILGAAFLGFEFAFVSSLPLIAELQPDARGQVLGYSLAFTTITRALGSFVGTWLYVQTSFVGVMSLAAGAAVVGLLAVYLVVEEPLMPLGVSKVVN